MNDLIRPALYQAHHEFLPVCQASRLIEHHGGYSRPDLRNRGFFRARPRDSSRRFRRYLSHLHYRRVRFRSLLKLQFAPAGL